jgi:hypothetical protein
MPKCSVHSRGLMNQQHCGRKELIRKIGSHIEKQVLISAQYNNCTLREYSTSD